METPHADRRVRQRAIPPLVDGLRDEFDEERHDGQQSSVKLTRERNMQFSIHADKRRQQRAIPQLVIDLLIEFGVSGKAGDGASRIYFNKSSRRKVATDLPPSCHTSLK